MPLPSDLEVPRSPQPSAPDPYVAYCFDEAVYMWGTYVDSELDQAGDDEKTKKAMAKAVAARQRRLSTLMVEGPQGEEIEAPVSKGQFRDPASMLKG